MKLSISQIHVGQRFRTDYGDVEDLAQDLAENGQITPITVRQPTPEEKELGISQDFILVAGGRRLRAAFTLGWTSIEAFDRGDIGPLRGRILELSENLKRKSFSWQEEVALKAEIVELRRLEDPSLTQFEIARELGETNANLSRDLETHRALVENPSLGSSATKSAALGASKILKQHRTRQATGVQAPAAQRPVPVSDLEEKIRTAEAVAFTKSLPSRSKDLALLDGPYGYNYWRTGHKSGESTGKEAHLSTYEDDPKAAGEMYRAFVPEVVRVVRETGWLVFFCGQETYELLEELVSDCCAVHASYRSSTAPRQCEAAATGARIGAPQAEVCRFLVPEAVPWIWYRPNSRNNPRYKHLHAKNVYEVILVVNMGKGQLLKSLCPNVLVFDNDYEDRVHGNQKPVALYREIIERLTFVGDSVLDTFHGSGNSLAAAASLDRDPWGCDLNPTMHQFAIASVSRFYKPINPALIKESHERYRRGLLRSGEGAEDFAEEDSTEPGPSYGHCPTCSMELDSSNASRTPSGKLVHINCGGQDG